MTEDTTLVQFTVEADLTIGGGKALGQYDFADEEVTGINSIIQRWMEGATALLELDSETEEISAMSFPSAVFRTEVKIRVPVPDDLGERVEKWNLDSPAIYDTIRKAYGDRMEKLESPGGSLKVTNIKFPELIPDDRGFDLDETIKSAQFFSWLRELPR